MGFPRWLRIVWWGAAVCLLTYFLWNRRGSLAGGDASPFDIVVFLVWTGLLLAPLFAEVKLFGFEFKNVVEQLRSEVRSELALVRAELVAVQTTNNVNSMQVVLPQPPADNLLPVIESNIKKLLAEPLRGQSEGGRAELRVVREEVQAPVADLRAPPAAQELFVARYNLERQLRLIADINGLDTFSGRQLGVFQLIRTLQREGLLDPHLGAAIQDVYAVCSVGLHGGDVTDEQAKFVRDVAPGLVKALRGIGVRQRPAQ